MNILKSKGDTSIGIVTALSAITVVLFSWNGWNSIKTIYLGEQTSAILEWQKTMDKKIDDYQDSADLTFEKIKDDVTQVKIDSSTTKELVKLIGDRYQINSSMIEDRVTRRVNSELSSTTTLI